MSHHFSLEDRADPLQEKLYYKGGIDGKTAADHLIFTTANNTKTFVVTQVFLIWESVSGFLGGPSINVGQTGASYNDIVNAGGLAVASTDGYRNQTIASTALCVAANTGLYLRVNTIGSGTTLTLGCYVKGYYRA